MALHSATVGSVGQPFVSEIDARWVMSYAAGLDDYLPCYMDTCRPGRDRCSPALSGLY